MGRSRGGLTSRIHAVVDSSGLPVRHALTTGEAHDNRLATKLLSRLKSGSMLLADRGYDADWIRTLVRHHGAWANIPPKSNRKDALSFSPYLTALEPGRTVLQQDQAVSASGNTLRQARGQLPRLHSTCVNPGMAAR
jgi:transposase